MQLQMDKRNNVLVSVIMPNFNGADHLGHAMRSVLVQTEANLELIVVDDGSTDESLSVARPLTSDNRVRLVSYSENKGVSHARNVGIEESRGRFIAFLDSDDFWFSNKISEQLKKLRDDEEAVACHANTIILSGDETRIRRVKQRVCLRDMRARNHIPNLTGMYDTSVCGKVYQPCIRHEDYCMWHDVLKFGHSIGVSTCLAVHRRHSNNLTNDKLSSAIWHFRALRQHIGASTFDAAMLTGFRTLLLLWEAATSYSAAAWEGISQEQLIEIAKLFDIDR
jgi:teichuronic acid biosynthesis glycosyltransferase TuaG